jgi:hypothetical protein
MENLYQRRNIKIEVLELPGLLPGADGKIYWVNKSKNFEGASVNEFFLVRYVGVNAQTGWNG